ncbi:MAG: phosphotransferase [Alphaproteobacteria bacterium]|nr:phosphotransferase [Alphaproteobacteria bacterium]
MTDRQTSIGVFLDRHGWGAAARRPLANDASFRRYERLQREGDRALLMDAPPPREDVQPFMTVAALLHRLGLSAPAVHAADVEAGLLLLEDLGDETYTRVLGQGGDEAALYALAVDVLIALHERFDTAAADVPTYDDTRLLDEAALLVDWYLPAVRGADVTPATRAEYLDLWRDAFAIARAAPPTLVLRDYHVDNLMHLSERSGVQACGLLDFQDAVIGPRSYDLVSLLEDARRDVPAALARRMLTRYLDAFPALDRDAFMASYAVLGAQRSAKILGIFTRLDRRDGKPVYLEHIPRVWRWLEQDLGHPSLAAVKAWFDREAPAGTRLTPPPGERAS